MKKLAKKDQLTLFLETCGFTFCEGSLAVITSLLSKRKSLNNKTITETIEVVSRENALNKKTCSVLLSQISQGEVRVTVTSDEGVDTLKIKTKYTPHEIYNFLKKSPGVKDFVVRIDSHFEKK